MAGEQTILELWTVWNETVWLITPEYTVGPLLGEIEYYFPTKLVEEETVEKILNKVALSRTRNV